MASTPLARMVFSIIAAISVKVTDPVFESQTKIKLGSKEIEPGVSMRNFVVDFLGKHLDDEVQIKVGAAVQHFSVLEIA